MLVSELPCRLSLSLACTGMSSYPLLTHHNVEISLISPLPHLVTRLASSNILSSSRKVAFLVPPQAVWKQVTPRTRKNTITSRSSPTQHFGQLGPGVASRTKQTDNDALCPFCLPPASAGLFHYPNPATSTIGQSLGQGAHAHAHVVVVRCVDCGGQ